MDIWWILSLVFGAIIGVVTTRYFDRRKVPVACKITNSFGQQKD